MESEEGELVLDVLYIETRRQRGQKISEEEHEKSIKLDNLDTDLYNGIVDYVETELGE
jgi:hypothetical protein